MKILFVDDEPRILEGIERMLFDLSDEWDMSFVESGVAALEILDRNPMDVIVADMRMPGMDGAALLKEVQTRFPAMVRIVLSGHAELEATLRAVPVAHQYLAKPCKPELLRSVVERAISLQAVLHDKTVRRIVGNIETLPSVPRIYSELTKALAKETTDVEDIAKIISKDIAMSAKVLQLVNSAFFNQASTISSTKQAVVRLGLQMVKNLALAIEVFQNSESAKIARGFSIEAAQNHAFQTAALAREIISDKSLSEDVFMAAILHDIGKLVLAKELPEKFEAAQSLAAAEQQPIHIAEKQLIGVTHAEIGGYLLGIWGLPYPIVEAVANHHEPARVPMRTKSGILEAVYVANCLANEAELDEDFLEETGMRDQVESWREKVAGSHQA